MDETFACYPILPRRRTPFGSHTKLPHIDHRSLSKLEVFIVNWPLSIYFSGIANALCTFVPHSLRVLQIIIPTPSLAKLIYMLQCLPNLVTVQVEFDGPPPEHLRLGAAGDLELTLAKLKVNRHINQIVGPRCELRQYI